MYNPAEEAQHVELFISCRNLKDKDVFSKSDPFAILRKKNQQYWVDLGRTETIDDNSNPNFQKSFIIDYSFQTRQEFQIEVRDDDDGSSE